MQHSLCVQFCCSHFHYISQLAKDAAGRSGIEVVSGESDPIRGDLTTKRPRESETTGTAIATATLTAEGTSASPASSSSTQGSAAHIESAVTGQMEQGDDNDEVVVVGSFFNGDAITVAGSTSTATGSGSGSGSAGEDDVVVLGEYEPAAKRSRP